MLIFTKITEIRAFLDTLKNQQKTVGFVPTMGALHRGHVSLIQQSKKQCDVTICSIFVNPTQFNDKKDLDRYPRMPEKDIQLLKEANCNVLFMPSEDEMYPKQEKEAFNFGYLDNILEGKYRPGHFSGVAQVVKRFFEIINPTKAFFGSKDYQQVMIVKALVTQMRSDIEIIACPILREHDGLAMSSRNALLNEEERKVAAIIPKLVQEANKQVKMYGIDAALTFVEKEASINPLMKLDYFAVCNANDLVPVTRILPNTPLVSLIAVFVGKIRLIDNLQVN
jgi:pantoate--beta-alanine ligase